MGGVTKAAHDIYTTAENIGQSIIDNPLPVLETIALTPFVGGPAASAIVNYANGGDATSAIKAGAVSLVGQTAGDVYAPAAQAPDNIDVGGGFNPATGASDVSTAQAAASAPSAVEKSAVSGGASGATQAALSGGSLSDIAKGGAVGALSGAGGQYASDVAGFSPGSAGSTLTKQVVGGTISGLFSPQSSTSYTAPTSVTTTGAGASPGSAALAQALRTDLGAPIFGGEKDKNGQKSGWNVESLRYMGGTGEA